MARSRLEQALDEGAVSLPEGAVICVLGAPADYDLSAISGDLRIAAPFRPDFDAWAARGYDVSPEPENGDAALVILPRAKAAAFSRIAQANALVPRGAAILVDGLKGDGVDAVLKKLRGACDLSPSFSKAHGKIAQFDACDLPADWLAESQSKEGFATAPGAFSADGVDPGSQALVAALPALRGRVADFGSGWGYLSIEALKNEGITRIDLFEADYHAHVAAQKNISDARAHFHWADVPVLKGDGGFDVILSNPPFHTSRKADPELGRGFIRAAARNLARGGDFYMVANRHLPYENALKDAFIDVKELPGSGAFKLFHAKRPHAPAR